MHPTLMHEIARYRQADMLREAQRARLAHEFREAAAADRPRRRFWLRRRREAAATARPVFGR